MLGTWIIITIMGLLVLSVALLVPVFIGWRYGPRHPLLKQGTPGEATILEIRDTGIRINVQLLVKLTLEVRVPGWEAYQAETKMVTSIVDIPQFQPGAVTPVKVDSNNRSKVALDMYG